MSIVTSEKNHGTGPLKIRKTSGRKPGYVMKEWQKDIQRQNVRYKEAVSFCAFLDDFMSSIYNMIETKFYIFDSRDTEKVTDDKQVYILTSIKKGRTSSETILYFQNISEKWKRLSFKAFEFYETVRNHQSYPLNEEDYLKLQSKIYLYVAHNRHFENKKKVLKKIEENASRVDPLFRDQIQELSKQISPYVFTD